MKVGMKYFGKNFDCFKCDSSGKVRNNTSDENGFTFGKVICDECKGTGQHMKSIKE